MSSGSAAVLVVDDDQVNRMLLARSLEREGHRATTAENGRVALELLRAEPFDVVLLDLVMPELDGYGALAELKADPRLRHLPVIMISAQDDAESVVRAIELGADDYLPKPFDPVLLRARMNAGLTRKRLHDLELEYLEQVGHVVDAAAAVEAGSFELDAIDHVAAREDALGRLARVFQRMAREVAAREQKLREEVRELRIEIDKTRTERRVEEITETDYFRALELKVDELRLR